jgi:hypothetical protein
MTLLTWIGRHCLRLYPPPAWVGCTHAPSPRPAPDGNEPLETLSNHIPTVDELECAHGITFFQLVDCDRRLESLLWEARQVGAGCRSKADVQQAFFTVRNKLCELVGFSSRNRHHRLLGSVEAYEVVYWKLFHAVAELAYLRASLDVEPVVVG